MSVLVALPGIVLVGAVGAAAVLLDGLREEALEPAQLHGIRDDLQGRHHAGLLAELNALRPLQVLAILVNLHTRRQRDLDAVARLVAGGLGLAPGFRDALVPFVAAEDQVREVVEVDGPAEVRDDGLVAAGALAVPQDVEERVHRRGRGHVDARSHDAGVLDVRQLGHLVVQPRVPVRGVPQGLLQLISDFHRELRQLVPRRLHARPLLAPLPGAALRPLRALQPGLALRGWHTGLVVCAGRQASVVGRRVGPARRRRP
mmetsp:Transcript_24489/g.77000  ORF Transcript_24489/g.77000 Transcript_24489/m.77000 type:complete len:259 (-) Transcript_24489:160-936(-)